jgi:hypothetical protein
MGYNSKIKEKIDVKPKMIKDKLCDLKQFIELPNQDKDVVVEKKMIQLIDNSPSADEMNIIVEHDPESEEKGINMCVSVDDSFASEIEDIDTEKERSEDESILNYDGETEKFQEYTKNLVIPHSPESETGTRGKVKLVPISADLESSDEESGT